MWIRFNGVLFFILLLEFLFGVGFFVCLFVMGLFYYFVGVFVVSVLMVIVVVLFGGGGGKKMFSVRGGGLG